MSYNNKFVFHPKLYLPSKLNFKNLIKCLIRYDSHKLFYDIEKYFENNKRNFRSFPLCYDVK